MEPVTKKIKLSPEKPEAESADHREDLRRKDEVIARLNGCLREKEEEIARLNECVSKLKEELKNVEARRNGIAESHQNSAEGSSSNQPSVERDDGASDDDDDSNDEDIGTAETVGRIKGKWKKRFNFPLLQVYAKYKTELECPGDTEEHEVWTKISNEVRERCPTTIAGLQCMLRIEELRKKYERLKNADKISKRQAKFFQEAKHTFEKDGNSVTSPDTSNKWCKNRPLKLLQVYTKYKTELSHPNAAAWREVAADLRIKHNIACDDSECRNKIDQLRSKYERLKTQSVPNVEVAMFLDAAKRAFETTATPVAICEENLLNVQKRKAGFRLRLLQVYATYRHELSRPGVDEESVWEKVAQELREFSYNCGPYLCRHELSRLKEQYEYLKGGDPSKKPCNPIDMRNFYQDARNAFED